MFLCDQCYCKYRIFDLVLKLKATCSLLFLPPGDDEELCLASPTTIFRVNIVGSRDDLDDLDRLLVSFRVYKACTSVPSCIFTSKFT